MTVLSSPRIVGQTLGALAVLVWDSASRCQPPPSACESKGSAVLGTPAYRVSANAP